MVVPCCRWVGVPSHSLTGANLNGVTVTSTTNSNTVTWSDKPAGRHPQQRRRRDSASATVGAAS